MNVMPSSIARTSRAAPAANVTGATATPARASRVGVANSMQGHATVQRLAAVRPLEQSQTHISVATLQEWAKPNLTAKDVSSGAQPQRQAIVNALLLKQHNGMVSVPALKQTVDEVLKQLAADIKTSIKKGEGRTPTFVAARHGHADCLKLLIHAGTKDLNQAQNEGVTPACVAAFHGHADCLTVLINAGADLNQAQNEGATPTYVAAFHGHADCLSILINAGADLDQAQNEGATPALVAACNGHTNCLILLHRAGVDLSLETPLGTPLSVAEKMGHTATASTIRELLLESSPALALVQRQANPTLALALSQSTKVTPALLSQMANDIKSLYDLTIALQLVSRGLDLGEIALNDDTRYFINQFFWAAINNTDNPDESNLPSIYYLAVQAYQVKAISESDFGYIKFVFTTNQRLNLLEQDMTQIETVVSQQTKQMHDYAQQLNQQILALSGELAQQHTTLKQLTDGQQEIADKMLQIGQSLRTARQIGTLTKVASSVVSLAPLVGAFVGGLVEAGFTLQGLTKAQNLMDGLAAFKAQVGKVEMPENVQALTLGMIIPELAQHDAYKKLADTSLKTLIETTGATVQTYYENQQEKIALSVNTPAATESTAMTTMTTASAAPTPNADDAPSASLATSTTTAHPPVSLVAVERKLSTISLNKKFSALSTMSTTITTATTAASTLVAQDVPSARLTTSTTTAHLPVSLSAVDRMQAKASQHKKFSTLDLIEFSAAIFLLYGAQTFFSNRSRGSQPANDLSKPQHPLNKMVQSDPLVAQPLADKVEVLTTGEVIPERVATAQSIQSAKIKPTLLRQDSGLGSEDGNRNRLAASIKANYREGFDRELRKAIDAGALNTEVQRSVNTDIHSTVLDIAAHYGRLDMAKAIEAEGGESLRHGDPIRALRIAERHVGQYDDFGNKIEA